MQAKTLQTKINIAECPQIMLKQIEHTSNLATLFIQKVYLLAN